MLLKAKIEYQTELLKADHPSMSRDSIVCIMKGLCDGIDYSKTLKPIPPLKTDKASVIQRAQAMSSCYQSKEFEDKDPNGVFKREVKRLFGKHGSLGNHGCIPTSVLQEAVELLNMKRYDEKLDRWHEKVYGKGNELNHEQGDLEQNYFEYKSVDDEDDDDSNKN